ncbi:hypothetical protein SLW70_10985 [Flavobacterium sp. NG2]|uniref:hypothetical protein n=1 Tax=Flavobacterium sp. NG2 TaxID=3097547 RepID=UPI002A7F5092|nr:hypothetical protein [Flavobacterium sp. NG2]WPR70467.1 hypothetical protein SLW70_10985 [Flavobacterium sp. NG2]
MLQNKKIILALFLLFNFSISYPQIKKTDKDSIEVYKKIQTYSTKNKFTRLLHKLIFEPISTKPNKPRTVKQINHKRYNGKIVRNINITTLDPFGFSDSDTLRAPKKWEEKLGNALHLKSKKIAIQNLLLFKKNSPFNAMVIQETERIIRSQRFVNQVTITEKLTSKKSDSVDVYVRVLDSWSTVPTLQVSSSKVKLGLNERNIFGIGHQFDYQFTNRFEDSKDAHDFTYTVPNIKNSFIKTVLKYNKDLDNFYDKSILVERPFYSPLTKWAGGIYLGQLFRSDSLQGQDLSYQFQNFKNSTHDFWAAKAFTIFKRDTTNNKTTNFIVSSRFLNINYVEKPTIEYDPINFFSNEKQLLMGFGINTRRFIEDKYIFKYGITEDVPIGQIYGITTGYQYKNTVWRPYLGAQIAIGRYFKWGYLSTNLEAGSFFNESKSEQTAISFQANYFTRLLQIGDWKIRQFIKPIFLIGFNRQNSIGDLLTINERYGIQGFNSPIYGTDKMLWIFQTQTYTPKNIGGFRLNPYFNYSIAMLGNVMNNFPDKKVYSKIGLGVIISNDYLVFSSFQLSLSYYPTIPLEGDSIFRTNAFENDDFGFQSFELAKPKTVIFK